MNRIFALWLVILLTLLASCGKNEPPTLPLGQSVTILITPTPTVPAHAFLGSWGSGGTAPGEFDYPDGLWVDPVGNIYVSDTGNARIQEILVAASVFVTWGGSGMAVGQFHTPWGTALDPADNLWVADGDNNRLQELPAGSGTWITIGGTASGTGPGQFNDPRYLAFDRAGDLFLTDGTNNRLQELPAGLAATVAANWVTIGGTASGSGPGQFNVPVGIAFDIAGDLYVMDAGNSRIQELPAGEAATVAANWAAFGSYGTGPGQFNAAFGLGTDPSGNLYVADRYNNRIQELPAGKAGTVAANWITIGGTASGSGPGQFSLPTDVKTDSQGNVYVADSQNNRIVKLAP